MSRREEFERSLAYGKEGEHAVARKLMACGSLVTPLYQFENHNAPPVALYEVDGIEKSIVLPDLSCFSQDGEAYLVEVKRKTRWVLWDGMYETGFNQRHFDHYMEMVERTKQPCWCFFVHENQEPHGVWYGEIRSIAPHGRRWNGYTPSGRRVEDPLILFPRDVLKFEWTLEEIGLGQVEAAE